jgi:hypothetical protein
MTPEQLRAHRPVLMDRGDPLVLVTQIRGAS